MNPIVLVGNRPAGNDAVRALGFTPIVLTVSNRPEQAAEAFGGTMQQAMAMLEKQLTEGRPHAVIGMAEGSVCVAAALREGYGLPGLSFYAAYLAHDKLAMKQAISKAGIPCARWLEVTEDTTATEIADTLGFPVVLKVPISSGGRGVRVLRNLDELAAALTPGLLAEAFVQGQEMSVESFQFQGRLLFRNHTCYTEPGWSSIVPAGLPLSLGNEVDALAYAAHEALELSDGITHMEIFLTEAGPVFGEIAARPPGGRIMNLMELAYDFDPWLALVRIALGEIPDMPLKNQRFAGANLLYPSPGEIQAIHGIEEARCLPGVVDIKCHARIGDVIDPRLGTGQNKGHVFVTHPDFAGCQQQLRTAKQRIRFDMRQPQYASIC